jgi:hypothetical protein
MTKKNEFKWQCAICNCQFEEKAAHGCLNGTNPKNWIHLNKKSKYNLRVICDDHGMQLLDKIIFTDVSWIRLKLSCGCEYRRCYMEGKNFIKFNTKGIKNVKEKK